MSLTLKCKRGQVVRVGEAVLTVVASGFGGARLRIDAPQHVEIVRLEDSDDSTPGTPEVRSSRRAGRSGSRSHRIRLEALRQMFVVPPLLKVEDRTDALARWVHRRRLLRGGGSAGPALGC